MAKTPRETYDERLNYLIGKATAFDIQSDDAKNAMRNLKTFSECRPPADPDPEPEAAPVIPLTKWQTAWCWAGRIADNETTRVTIKAIGSLAAVGLVAWSTIHKDHVLERQALNQANQRN